jgi:putative addiction module killer protein
MTEIKRLPEFDEWLDSIKDSMTRLKLNRRLDKVQRGNWGDVKHLQKVFGKCDSPSSDQVGACITSRAW